MSFNLPDGITMEQLERYAVEKQRRQRNEYNRAHPEKVMAQRITAAKNLIQKNGGAVVMGPCPDADDWDNPVVQQMLLAALRTAAGRW